MKNTCSNKGIHPHNHPHPSGHRCGRRGPTSYKMHNSELVFENLALKPESTFVDMGCGPGDYSVRAAREIGPKGLVFALDSNKQMLNEVCRLAEENDLENIATVDADMVSSLPFGDETVDVCFMSTSLHCMDLNECGQKIFTEVLRVLKSGGAVAVLECKKEEMDFGPPMSMRISADDIKAVAEPLGFVTTSYLDLGVNYLIVMNKV